MQLCASLVPPRGSQAVDQRLEQIVEQGALAGTDEHLHGHSRAQRLIAELQPRQFVGADPDADTLERLTALLVLQPIGRDLLDLAPEPRGPAPVGNGRASCRERVCQYVAIIEGSIA